MAFPRPLAALAGLLLALLLTTSARAAGPTAFGLFFYTPTCGFCHEVIENHWPGVQQEFGDQLQVLFINAATPEGGALMSSAQSAMAIDSNAVPMLILGSEVMIGAAEIPARAAPLIREGLAGGGIPYPPIPGVDAIFQRALGPDVAPAMPGAALPPAEPAADITTDAASVSKATVGERLAADPVANGLAIGLLALLVGTLLSVPYALRRSGPRPAWVGALHRAALVGVPLLGMVIAIALIAGASGEPLLLALGVAEFLLFLALFLHGRRPRPAASPADWRLPLAGLVGLGVAGYLASVELTRTEAVCGLVGNCNLVQQSPYAALFGIPIGVIGLVGYALILGLWLLRRARGPQHWRAIDGTLAAALFGGVAFSAYLTALEPFVIGATCLWCLSSAAIMLLMLLWLIAPPPIAPRRGARQGRHA